MFDRLSEFDIVVELSLVAVLTGTRSIDELTRFNEHVELTITVLAAEPRPQHFLRHVGALTETVIIADRVADLISVWRWAQFFHGWRLETIICPSERVAAISPNSACQGLSNFFHVCVSETAIVRVDRRVDTFETERSLCLVKLIRILQD